MRLYSGHDKKEIFSLSLGQKLQLRVHLPGVFFLLCAVSLLL